MHEITLCQHMADLIETQARRHAVHRVTAVWVDIGAFSCTDEDALQFCFGLACRGTRAEGCALHLRQLEAECWCYDCQSDCALMTAHVKICSRCGGKNLRIVADDSVKITKLQFDEEVNNV